MRSVKNHFKKKFNKGSESKSSMVDELIDVSQKQFYKQQTQISDLQKCFRTFSREITSVTDSIDRVYSCFKNIYEPEWVGYVEFHNQCQESVNIWRQFITDFSNNISQSLDEYGREFPDMKKCIEKRNRKLSELNKQKKAFETYRNSKKSDATKLQKMNDELNHSQQQFTNINNNLKATLPQFCDKRIRVYVDLWTKLFHAEEALFSFQHHSRIKQIILLSKLATMVDSVDYSIVSKVELSNGTYANLVSSNRYSQSAMTLADPDYRESPQRDYSIDNYRDSTSPIDPYAVDDPYSRAKSFPSNGKALYSDSNGLYTNFISPSETPISLNDKQRRPPPRIPSVNESDDDDTSPYSKITIRTSVKSPNVRQSYNKLSRESARISGVYDTIPGGLYYYQVVATFEYHKVDDDELDLMVDDIMLVLPWEHEDQIEDGWLYGENVVTKKRGLFPENHIARLNL